MKSVVTTTQCIVHFSSWYPDSIQIANLLMDLAHPRCAGTGLYEEHLETHQGFQMFPVSFAQHPITGQKDTGK
jgi:hypothetical protein